MKKYFILFVLFTVFESTHAQTSVYLKINHTLGSDAFSFNSPASNNQGDNFEFTRLEYYISEIRLVYDGGQDTVLEDTYLLATADQPVNVLLGQFNISQLESIEFGIGVDPNRNHADPSTYPSGHPLAFHTPSMHWGWAAGYRFIAMEGNTGAGMSQGWQLHALGDKNYGYVSVSTTGAAHGQDLIISLDADYQKAFENLSVDANLNYHGEDQQAPTLFQNFHNEVFSVGGPDVSIKEIPSKAFSLAPNPSSGNTTLSIMDRHLTRSEVVIVDITGRTVLRQILNDEKELKINIQQPGIYLVSLQKNGQVLNTHKLIVQ